MKKYIEKNFLKVYNKIKIFRKGNKGYGKKDFKNIGSIINGSIINEFDKQ